MTQATIEAPNAIAENLDKVQTELAAIDKIDAGLAALEKAHPKNLACDVATTKGMKEAIAGRAAWREPRIATEKARKAAKAPVLELGRAIDARAAELTALLLEGESNYDDQIKAEEARKESERAAKAEAERARIQGHQDRINEIRGAVAAAAHADATLIAEHIGDVERLPVDATFEEFQGQAQLAKDETLVKLRAMHADAVAREEEAARVKAEQEAAAAALAAERAELERLRAEQAERERVAAAEQAERARIARAELDAAEKAQADKLAAERAEQEQALAAEREAHEAEMRAQREAQAEADAQAAAARKVEDDRIAAQLAELAAQREQQAAAARAAEEAKHAAEKRVRDAAPQMLAALKAVLASGARAEIEDHVIAAVEHAVEDATGLPA